jgi:hypothetical protein
MNTRFSCLLLALAALLPFAAAATPLSVLIQDPKATIEIGDKQFSDFSYSFTGDMPDASQVEVVAITDKDGNFGLRFQGAFIDTTTPGGSDALIGYTVNVLGKDQSIVGAHMAGNPTLLGCVGSISVVDSFDFDPELRLRIFADQPGAGTQSADWVDFEPLQSIRVLKDILGFAGNGSVTLSFVDQTFRQAKVPEPAALLLLGAMGLALARRRRA